MNEGVREAIDKIKGILESADIPTVAVAVFKAYPKPSDRWSFFNRILMVLSGTRDARGYRQWQEAERYVKYGSHAIHILAPRFIKKEDKKTVWDEETGEAMLEIEEKTILSGFLAVPVFRCEDTEGQPLPDEKYKLDIPVDFNGIITELGLKISSEGFTGYEYGHYNPARNEIKLATPMIKTFLHELAHAVDDKLNGVEPGQRPDQEITAEFSAAVIAYLMGYDIPLGNAQDYIRSYAKNDLKTVFAVLDRIEQVVSYIIGRTSQAEIGTNNAAAGTPAAA